MFLPGTVRTPVQKACVLRCIRSSQKLSSPQTSRSLLDSPCTELILWTSCNFLLRTLCRSVHHHQAPSSPPCKCTWSSLEASRRPSNNRGMTMPRLLNTCLHCMRCIGLIPATPCKILPHTVCTFVHRAQCSLHCTCKLPTLCSLSVQSKNILGTRGMSRPHLLQNMSLPHNRCTHLLPLRPCTFRARIVCTPLQLDPRSPRCRCSL